MRTFLLLLLTSFTLTLLSCSWYYYAYIRNPTNSTAIVDVYLLDKSNLNTLPNKVRIAERVVNFKAGYKKYFEHTQNVKWIDTSHFMFEIKPNTTLDLTEMTGKFRNGGLNEHVRVIVSTEGKVDTLINGDVDDRRNKFQYDHVGLSTPLLYYDIKD
jgi:hypothetical protein